MTAQGIIASCATGPLMVGPPALSGVGAPPSTLKGILGQEYIDTSLSPRKCYVYTGAEWITDAQGTGDVDSVTGTANQITSSPTTGDVVLTIPATFIAPGSIASTTTITAATGLTVTAGGAAITGTTTINTTGAAVTTIGTGGTGAVNIGNATGNTAVTGSLTASTGLVATTGGVTASAGNIVATLGDITTAAGSITSATTLTATLGAITATNGNLVLGTAGNKLVYTSVASNTTAAGANSAGTVTLTGGTATVSTTAVTASSLIRLTRQSVGATGANDLGILSVGTIVAATSFEINAWTVTDATTLQGDDVSIIFWEIVN